MKSLRIISASGTSTKLLKVLNLGNMGWTSFLNSFAGNSNLTTVLGGNTSQVRNMSSTFYGACSDPETSGWDTSRVTNMISVSGALV